MHVSVKESVVGLYSCEDMNKSLLTSDKESTTDQNTDTAKVQLGESMSYIGVTCRNMNEGLLTGAEMIQQ